MDAFERFAAWVKLIGGPTAAAAELARVARELGFDRTAVDVGHVSHITKRRRRPGVDLVVPIQAATRRLVGGAIRVEDWSAVRADRRHPADRASRGAGAKARRSGRAQASTEEAPAR